MDQLEQLTQAISWGFTSIFRWLLALGIEHAQAKRHMGKDGRSQPQFFYCFARALTEREE